MTQINYFQNFKTEKYIHPLQTSIWSADLADMQLISKFKHEIIFL